MTLTTPCLQCRQPIQLTVRTERDAQAAEGHAICPTCAKTINAALAWPVAPLCHAEGRRLDNNHPRLRRVLGRLRACLRGYGPPPYRKPVLGPPIRRTKRGAQNLSESPKTN